MPLKIFYSGFSFWVPVSVLNLLVHILQFDSLFMIIISSLLLSLASCTFETSYDITLNYSTNYLVICTLDCLDQEKSSIHFLFLWSLYRVMVHLPARVAFMSMGSIFLLFEFLQ